MTDTTAPTDLPETDAQIIDELRKRCATLLEEHDHVACVRYALENDASAQLVRQLLQCWYVYSASGYAERTHPYAELVTQLRGNEFARQLIAALCADEDSAHRKSFWLDEWAWLAFDTEATAMAMARQLGAADPNRFTSTHYSTLSKWFEMVGLGAGYVQLLMREVLPQITFIDDPRQLDLVLQLLRPQQIAEVAAACPPSGLNLVLMGYILASHPGGARSQRCIDVIEMHIGQRLDRSPHLAPVIWRWVAEGFRRQAVASLRLTPELKITADELWLMRMEESSVHRQVTSLGWQLAAVNHDLTVQLPGTKPPQQHWLQHNPGATWRLEVLPDVIKRAEARHQQPPQPGEVRTAEQIQPGDLVLVHGSLAKGRPRLPGSGPVTYSVALMPAAPPDHQRLAWRDYFLDSNLHSPWRPGMI